VSGPELWAGVLVLGGIGAVARLTLDKAVSRRLVGAFPAGTLAVNGSGAFALGLLTGLGVSADVAVLVGTGLIGAYTTFSTWMLESHRLAEDRRANLALWNIGGSVLIGVVLATAGWALGALL
jgi:fluoride exporter